MRDCCFPLMVFARPEIVISGTLNSFATGAREHSVPNTDGRRGRNPGLRQRLVPRRRGNRRATFGVVDYVLHT